MNPFCKVKLGWVLVVTFVNKVSSQPDQFKLLCSSIPSIIEVLGPKKFVVPIKFGPEKF